MSEGWHFRVLGPLEVRYDGVAIPVAAAKQRVLLAVLAIEADQAVPAERLIACLWGEHPPSSARNSLQNYVLRLRRTLQPRTGPGPLVSSSAGYRLAVDAETVDVHRFDALLRRARAADADPESASALLDEALALWAGEPLADVPSDVLGREVLPGLIENHLAAQEQRIDVALRLGRHRDLVTELFELSARYPLRERVRAQLMLALYRSGRAAEALEAYRQAGAVLAEELGIDPGPELRRLHQAVLNNDPELAAPAPPAHLPAQRERIVPRQLPGAVGQFVGRTEELRQLSARLDGMERPPPVVIGGTAGIGKTTLALRWGQQHTERFPDGQLYVNLHGFDPSSEPVPFPTALRGLLGALGVPAARVPTGQDEQLARYRSELADRRMLLVLDNARDAQQVRPLLPGSPGCTVLITSRDQLAGLIALDGAVPVALDLLTRTEARDLLVQRLGAQRVERETAVVDELIEACARLPLALTIAAAHAALRPARPLAALAEELRDARRLDALSTGDAAADVRAVFSCSYRTLTPAAARMFRLLGLHPGPDISLPAIASLTALELPDARRALDELAQAHLVTERAPGRVGQHDLLRAYAVDLATTHESHAERHEALRRVLDWYLHTAYLADNLIDPNRADLLLDPPAPGVQPPQVTEVQAAMPWFDAEYRNLRSAVQAALAHAWYATVCGLAWSLGNYYMRRGNRHDGLTVWQASLTAAEHLPDPTHRIRAHRRLGLVNAGLGRHEETVGHLEHAFRLAEENHDLTQQGHTQQTLAHAWGRHGDDRRALEHATRAADHYRVLDKPEWEAEALNMMGWSAAQLGEYDAARAHCQAALALCRRCDVPKVQANTLDSLGYIDHHTGHHDRAVEYYRQALELFRAIDNTSETANTLGSLGEPLAALGAHDEARASWQEALQLLRQQSRDEDAERIQQRLDTLEDRTVE